jgi:hypothetical protein
VSLSNLIVLVLLNLPQDHKTTKRLISFHPQANILFLATKEKELDLLPNNEDSDISIGK